MKPHLLWASLASLILLMSACTAPGTAPGKPPLNPFANPSTAPAGPSAKQVFWAIYMVGGDLEDDLEPRNEKPDEQDLGKPSNKGAGSSDLRELLSAYVALSTAEKQNVDLLVGFGGARKQGWQGIKYADLPCLLQDARDDYFGNDSCYSYSQTKANLAEAGTLTHFIQEADTRSAGYQRRILEIWDHGVSYLGVGKDTNFGQDLIGLDEMRKAFGQARFELIALDACLMGSLEVARTLAPFAGYMVASEELEPGHGWNYTPLLRQLAQKPQMPVSDIGKLMVDSYLDSPEHKLQKNKTLSVLDLGKVSGVVEALGGFVPEVGPATFPHLLGALEHTQHYGVLSRSGIVTSMDTRHFAENLKKRAPAQAAAAERLIRSLGELVIYNRHDGTAPDSHGVSIFSLNKALKPRYGPEQAVSPAWLSFAERFVSYGISDGVKPVIKTAVAGMAIKAEDGVCSSEGEQGHCFEIRDDKGLARVEQVFAVRDGGKTRLLGSEELETIDDDEVVYFGRLWDGGSLALCLGGCDKGKVVFAPAYYDEQTEDGTYIYTTSALLNDEDVEVYLEIDEEGEAVDYWAVPYIDEAGTVLSSRLQLDLEAGDEIAFYFQVLKPGSDEEIWETGETVTLTEDMEWTERPVPGQPFYFVIAEDYNGNRAVSKEFTRP